MVTYKTPGKTPGVYISEIDSGPPPIEGVSTSVTAFIGETEKGPLDKATLIRSTTDFMTHYGGASQGGWMVVAVQQFFDNGGVALYIARVDPKASTSILKCYAKAFELLDDHDDISLIALPGQGTPEMVRLGAAYCEKRRDCFFIGEMAESDQTVEDAKQFLQVLNSRSTYAAIYFPWLTVKHDRNTLMIPPSGAIAGMYARTDRYRGVWKAPAGVEAELHSIVSLSTVLNTKEYDQLNILGINVIRDIPNTGIVVMGARTVASSTSSEWKYVPIRRTAIYIEQSINKGTDWAVHEPNGQALWQKLEFAIRAFMDQLFRMGLFAGATADEAYVVRCDRSLQTQASIDEGVVRILVGFAPIRPAEFIILNIEKL